ncbi:DUF1571 domain-containing protein [Tautonia sociabilis]|uniref:DUF1571 domain-containing protein n=1 Tax=Tautonia sociabilis TaxID=2080755 RepID=A0A432MMN2_9BACT|nr:DUF1571 domain-containing protein [Tautonia sociabilis]RUL88499.1 DUF1571 domain-containing protein [Tautonia sociabilis]
MTSGEHRGRGAAARGSVLGLLAALAGLSGVGCAQLQTNWIDRIGADRIGLAQRRPPAERSRVSPEADDPYASRVGLDDRPPSFSRPWTPTQDRSAPPGAMPPPQTASLPEPPPIPPPTGSPVISATIPPPVPPPARPGRAVPPSENAPAAVSPSPPTVLASRSSPSSGPAEAPSPTAEDPLSGIDRVIERGITRLESLRNYRVSLDRQERVRGTLLPAERVTLSVRTAPFAVRLEWPDGPNRGREVLYSEAECGGLMHVKMGKTLIPIPPMQLAPNSPIAMSNSRHPITEAGLLHILTTTRDQLDASRGGDPSIGTFSIVGPLIPPECDAPCVEILRETPEGERWRLVVEDETGLPVLLEAETAAGELLERYHFQDLQTDLAELDAPGSFDPAVRFDRSIIRTGGTAEEEPQS